nr:hypothetical protein Iba_chr14dCG3250 [Ipomoea batatas]
MACADDRDVLRQADRYLTGACARKREAKNRTWAEGTRSLRDLIRHKKSYRDISLTQHEIPNERRATSNQQTLYFILGFLVTAHIVQQTSKLCASDSEVSRKSQNLQFRGATNPRLFNSIFSLIKTHSWAAKTQTIDSPRSHSFSQECGHRSVFMMFELAMGLDDVKRISSRDFVPGPKAGALSENSIIREGVLEHAFPYGVATWKGSKMAALMVT